MAAAIVGRDWLHGAPGHRAHGADAMDFHAVLAVTVGDQAVLAAGAVRAQRLRGPRKEVDRRRAAELEVFRLQMQACRRCAIEDQVQVERLSVGERAGQWQVEEVELVGEGEVLGEQAQARMSAVFLRQQRLVGGEADDLRQSAERRRRRAGRPRHDLHGMRGEQVVEDRAAHRRSRQVDAQALDRQFVPAVLAQAAQAQAQRRAGGADSGQGLRLLAAEEVRLVDRQRPQGRLGAAAEMHAVAATGGDEQRGVARQPVALGEVALGRVRFELDDRAGRQRAQRQRVELFEEGVAELRVVVVEAPLQARGEQREAFQQTLDVRVGAFAGGQLQAPGDLRIALGEGAAGVP